MTPFNGCFSLRVSTCLFIFTLCGRITGALNEPVKVKEGNDVILPCSLSTKEDIEFKLFDWKKDGQKEVFLYDGGVYYDNGLSGQDKQFKGRVSHFSDQLKNGVASIKIQNTKVADSGNYTCVFPRLQPSQTFHIELVVVGAAPKPYITIIDQTNDWSLLQCAVRGAFAEPKVEWKDSSGNFVPAEDPQVTKRGDKYDIILNATVTKTDHYRCEATQEEIFHQIDSKIFVHINGPPIGWIATAVSVICTLAAVGILLAVLYLEGFIKVNRQSKTGRLRHENGSGKPPGSHHKLECFDTEHQITSSYY